MDFSPIQIAIVLIIALLVFGPNRLPEMGRQLGRGIREAKRQMSELGNEVSRTVDIDESSSSTTTSAITSETGGSAGQAATSTADARSTSTDAEIRTRRVPGRSTGTSGTGGAGTDDGLLDGVLISGAPADISPASAAVADHVDDDDLLDGIVVSGDTPPGLSPEG